MRFIFLCVIFGAIELWSVTFHAGATIVPKKNEDRCNVVKDILPGIDLFFVCDGHGQSSSSDAHTGKDPAEFAKEKLPGIIKSHCNGKTITTDLLKESVALLAQQMTRFVTTGTTLAGILTDKNSLFAFNVGDSRIVLCNEGVAEQPLIEHSCDDDGETEHLVQTGKAIIVLRGCLTHIQINRQHSTNWKCLKESDDCSVVKAAFVFYGPTSHSVRYTRSLGDNGVYEGVIRSEADVKEIPLTKTYEFAIIASDGVFDTAAKKPISNQEAVEVVKAIIAGKSGTSCETIAQFASIELAKLAKQRLGYDDIAVIVIIFNHESESEDPE